MLVDTTADGGEDEKRKKKRNRKKGNNKEGNKECNKELSDEKKDCPAVAAVEDSSNIPIDTNEKLSPEEQEEAAFKVEQLHVLFRLFRYIY